jgi:amino acid adenylation domain-containing protein
MELQKGEDILREDRRRFLSGNAADMLFETAASQPDQAAVVADGAATSYRDLARQARSVASLLVRNGLEPGDRVGILSHRDVRAAACFFGALACGAVAVMVNELLRPRQIEHILGHSGAKFLLTTGEVFDRLPARPATDVLVLRLTDLPASDDPDPRRRTDRDVAQIIYTSGSTGLPKGVVLSHGNLWAGMLAVVDYLGISRDDRIASLLPFSFDYGLNQLLCCAGTGATLVVERSPVPQRIVQTLRREAVSVLPAVPPLWLQLLGVEAFSSEPLESLRVMTNTGGRLPAEAVRKLRRCQPEADLVLMYGLTEAFRSAYLPPEQADHKPTSVGRAIPGAELLVLNDELSPCKPNEVGMLVHRGPTVALGYWNDEEATAKVFRDNPLRPAGTPPAERVVFSGDLVYRDEDGDLYVVGREDGLIKTMGYRVSPDEIVDVLYASGQVVEALVTSEPDELRGSRIVAYVVLAEQGRLDRLMQFAAEQFPRYMQPSRIEARRALQRTSSGKHDAAATVRHQDDPD